MCEPSTILATQLAMTAAQHYSAQQAAVEGAKRQNSLWIQNEQNARTGAVGNFRDINRRKDQEGKATAQKKFDKMVEGMRNRAAIKTKAGSTGVGGQVVNQRLNQVTRDEGTARTRLDTNNKWKQSELNSQKDASIVNYKNQVNSVQKGQAPSATDAFLGMAMDMGMQVAGNYMMYQSGLPTQTPNPTGGAVAAGGSTAVAGGGTVVATAQPNSYFEWLKTGKYY